MADQSNGTPQVSAAGPLFREAHDETANERVALTEQELAVINVDIPNAITIALGATKQREALRPRIVKELPLFDIARYDKIERYALALWHSQTLCRAASEPVGSLQGLYEEGVARREVLVADLTALAKRGLIDPSRLKELIGPVGYRPLAADLTLIPTLMRDNWAAISGKTAVTPEELDRAEIIAGQILNALGEREQAPVTAAEASLNRQRAYTLFIRAYEDARSAAQFLRRREGDAEEITPSLYAGRATSGRKDANTPVPIPPVTTPPPAGTAPLVPPANGQPKNTIPQGLPGANPYISDT